MGEFAFVFGSSTLMVNEKVCIMYDLYIHICAHTHIYIMCEYCDTYLIIDKGCI